MNFEEYEKGAWRTFAGQHDSYREQLLCCACGLSGESGEFTDAVKKFAFHKHLVTTGYLRKELGDILYYIAVAARVIGSSLEEVAAVNNMKLQGRYPDGFSPERSINREDS